MTLLRTSCLMAVSFALMACTDNGSAPKPDPSPSTKPVESLTKTPKATSFDLPKLFDCLRQEGGVAIAAHRGGPYPGFPENAIETFQHGYDKGVRVFEIDIAESHDGTLFLIHDRTLTRTTTGEGFVADVDWADIRALKLVDNQGTETGFSAPTLREALNWAVKTGAILELDKKPTTSFKNIISQVRDAKAENNILMISYNDQQAGEIAKVAPDLMMTASAFGDRDIAKLKELGVKAENLIAWTGTRDPDFAAWQRVLKEGVEPAFGTLGRPGDRLDDTYLEDGDGSEFLELEAKGLVLLATDIPLEVAEIISGDDTASKSCGL